MIGKVLVACEYSGRVRDAFAARDWYAMSCDLLPTERPGLHYQGDVRDILYDDWDLLIAHPPCTYLCNASTIELRKKPSRWFHLRQGAEFFKSLYEAPIKHRCIENPVMYGPAKAIIGASQTQVIQPYMFGEHEIKTTCLWLVNLPRLYPSNDVKPELIYYTHAEKHRLRWHQRGPERGKARSLTFQGIADAMAQQWTIFLLSCGTAKEEM